MNDSEKNIKNMTIAEILRRQMELLAEASENCCSIEELIDYTTEKNSTSVEELKKVFEESIHQLCQSDQN